MSKEITGASGIATSMTPDGFRRDLNDQHRSSQSIFRTSVTIDEESLINTSPAEFLCRLTNLYHLSIEKETFCVGKGKRVVDLVFGSKDQLELFKEHIKRRSDVKLTHENAGGPPQDSLQQFKRDIGLSKASFMAEDEKVIHNHEEKIQSAEAHAARLLETGRKHRYHRLTVGFVSSVTVAAGKILSMK